MEKAVRAIPEDSELAFQWNTFLADLLPRLTRADCVRLLELSVAGKIWLDRMDRIAIERRIRNIDALAQAQVALNV